MKRPPPPHEFKPTHTDGRIIGPDAAELGLGRYKRVSQLVVCGTIIGLIAYMLVTQYYQARGPARLSDCMGRLRVLGNALEMYRGDYAFRLPPGPVWRYAISGYVDMVGGNTEGIADLGRSARPRGFSSPMRCLANQTTNPISYFYLDPAEMRRTPELQDDSNLPVLVDETNHPRVVVLRSEWSTEAVKREDWVRERNDAWRIRRRPDWSTTFAYYTLPPPDAEPPPVSP